MSLETIPVYIEGSPAQVQFQRLRYDTSLLLYDHYPRAQKLIISIVLGSLSLTPFIYHTIRKKELITYSFIRSLPLFKKTLIISAIFFGMAVKYLIQQINSIRRFNKMWQDIQTKTYQGQYIISSIFRKELAEADTDRTRIGKYLWNVVKRDWYADICTYRKTKKIKYTLSRPPLSIFTRAGETTLTTSSKPLSEEFTPESQECLIWRQLLRELAPSKDKLPEGTLECLAAMSLNDFMIEKKIFGKNFDEPNCKFETGVYVVYYKIEFHPSGKRNLTAYYGWKKEDNSIGKTSVWIKTTDQFRNFLLNNLSICLEDKV